MLSRLYWAIYRYVDRLEAVLSKPHWDPPDKEKLWEGWFEYRLETLERRETWLLRLLVLHIVIDVIVSLVWPL